MKLHSPTFLFAIMVFTLVIAGLSRGLASQFPAHIKGLRIWGWGIFCGFLAALCFCATQFPAWPAWGAPVVGNICFVLISLLCRHAFRENLGTSTARDWPILWGIAALSLLGLIAVHYFELNKAHRGLFTLANSGVIYLLLSWEVFKAKGEHAALRKLTTVNFGLMGSVCLMRAVLYFTHPPTQAAAFSSTEINIQAVDGFFFFMTCFCALFMSVALILFAGSQLQRELSEVAMRDGLTGLFGRRAFFEIAGTRLTRTGELSSPMAVLMIDIDHFKKVNDTHGHQAGDEALRHAAQLLTLSLRERDIAARYGGEEFIVMLPDTAPQEALLVAERIRKTIAHAPAKLGETQTCALTLSIGLACFEPPATTPTLNELISLADKALYASKGAGRNRTTLSAPFSPKP